MQRGNGGNQIGKNAMNVRNYAAYRMVSNGISKMNYIVLQNIALHCTSMALYAYFIVYCMIPQIVYLQYIWSYIVLYCIVLLYITNALNHDQSFSLICPNEQSIRTNYTKSVKFHPKPVSELPLKEEKTCEFIQETRSWNNSLAVTDASQGKSNSNSMDYHTAWSWTWKLKITFQQFRKVSGLKLNYN